MFVVLQHIYLKVFNKAVVILYGRRCTEPMSSQFLRNLGLKMGIEHLWSYFDVLSCGDIVVWAVDRGWSHHHHLIISSSDGDSMCHGEGKVEVRFVEFKYRDDIHILLVTS